MQKEESTYFWRCPQVRHCHDLQQSYCLLRTSGSYLFFLQPSQEQIRTQTWCKEHFARERTLRCPCSNHEPHNDTYHCQHLEQLLPVSGKGHLRDGWIENDLTHERTLKNRDSSSSPIAIVRSVNTPVQITIRLAVLYKGEREEHLPTGKMKPHQPILNGKPPETAIMMTATMNQTIAKPHRMRPTMKPTV